jgi:hypothetical protein
MASQNTPPQDCIQSPGGFLIWAMPLVAFGFGLPSIKKGGVILFGEEGARHYVPFVLWFNFWAGSAYAAA